MHSNSAMQLELPSVSTDLYQSMQQRVRIATEGWTAANLFCPHCGGRLKPFPASTKSRDFYCFGCGEQFQLKSSGKAFKSSILDGRYEITLRSVEDGLFPSLLLLRYDSHSWSVEDTFAVHRAWITPKCVEPMKQLTQRPGYRLCNLRLDLMPQVGRIVIIRNGRVVARNEVQRLWSTSQKVVKLTARKRGWLADLIRCVERVNPIFSIDDVYDFKSELSRAHPENHNIEAKIRQQLQVLRDLEMVEFVKPGIYRRLLGS